MVVKDPYLADFHPEFDTFVEFFRDATHLLLAYRQYFPKKPLLIFIYWQSGAFQKYVFDPNVETTKYEWERFYTVVTTSLYHLHLEAPFSFIRMWLQSPEEYEELLQIEAKKIIKQNEKRLEEREKRRNLIK